MVEELGIPAPHSASFRRWMGIDHSNGQPKFKSDHTDWLAEVGVVRDHHSGVVVLVEAVKEHVRRDVYVRTLFLSLDDLRLPRPSRWRGVRQPHPSVTGQEVPEVNRYERECFERPEVGLLALRRLDVIRPGRDFGREV